MDENLKNRLIEKLNQVEKNILKDFQVVMLPDFFVDHFLNLKEYDTEFKRIKKIHDQGGGNVPGVSQKIRQGGNAANTALALAKLGINVSLICKTDPLGKNLLDFFLGTNKVNLEHVKTDGEIAITTAMEFGEKCINVLVGDTGSVTGFSYDVLDEKDLEIISSADLVGVVNWSLNKSCTDLAKNVFIFSKKHKTKTFFDSGDPEHRKDEIPELKRNVLQSRDLDILGVNENELKHYSNVSNLENDNNIVDIGIDFSKEIPARLDLHTKNFSCSFQDEHVVVPTMEISDIYQATGAGDTWNAGNIFGELLDFKADERLLFANIIAGFYVSSSQAVHPNLEEITEFIINR